VFSVKALPLADTTPPTQEDGLLIRPGRLWQLLAISAATGWRWNALGRLPRPINFASQGRSTLRWRLAEIQAWIEAGCPSRDLWEAIRDARRKT
jgi:predicted DNA-binding transcriptional regulator AlpA